MNFKSQLTGLNEFLTTIYGAETRLSSLLTELRFSAEHIALLRDQHLEPLVSAFSALILERVRAGEKNAPVDQIICRRYGLDGEPPEPPPAIGARLGLSGDLVRQLEIQAVRKCRQKTSRQFFTAQLHRISLAQLSAGAARPGPAGIAAKLDQLAEVQAAADVTRADYETKRIEIMKTIQAELDALEAEYQPLLQVSAEHAARLEAEIKNDVLLHGATVESRRWRAIYLKGRVSWDSQALGRYAQTHAEVMAFRKEGQPTVSVRAIKPD